MRPYAFGGYEYTFQDDQRTAEHGDGFFFGAGKGFNKYWGLEFGGFHDQFDDSAKNPNSWKTFGAEVDALFFYSRDPRFSPYFSLGAGGIRNHLDGSGTSTDPTVAAGVGFFKFFTGAARDLGFRADVRYRWSDTNDLPGYGNFNEPQVRIGLIMALGPRPETAKPVTFGPDRDQDGIADDADLCPNTPAGTKVNAKGCPVDSDGDGVPDELDRCPGTARGVKVDANGCPIEENIGANRRFEDVHFEFDRSDITDYGKAILDNAASAIKGLSNKYPKIKVELSGHTDWIGTDAYNQALSERRANVVKVYLTRKGIEGERISTYAYGESKPIATNDTPEGRALNRRTEVRTRE